MDQENKPAIDQNSQLQQQPQFQQRLQSLQQEQQQPQPQPQQTLESQPQQQHPQQPPVNKPMEKDLNLREYKNLIPKTIAEIQAIHERGKKLYSKRKHYRREPYPPPQRELTEEEKLQEKLQREKDIKEYKDSITYSSYYYDEKYQYRHVILPKMIARWLPRKPKLMDRDEWLSYGVTQSLGWKHYMVYAPEPHILLFRRDISYRYKQHASNSSSSQSKSAVPEDAVEKVDQAVEAKVEPVEEELVTSDVAPVRNTAYTRATMH